jgi:predicted dehydrogenase
MNKKDGMNYAPVGKPQPVVRQGEFVFAAAALDHGHIYGMCNGLIEAGATLKWVYDPDPAKVDKFVQQYPQVLVADSLDEILNDSEVHLVAGAAIPSERCALGLKTMAAGKDYFTDKAPLTTLEQLADAKAMVEKTGKKYAVYYSERLHVESAVFAGQLVQQGAIGRVINPGHRPSPGRARQARLVYDRRYFGGILCDIGSHQIEQFLFYTGNSDATVIASQARNTSHPQYPAFEDFGDAMLKGKTGPVATSAATGSRQTGFPPGAMDASRCSAPRAISRSANMSI